MSDFCGSCGKAFASDDRFCAGCGKPRRVESTDDASSTSTEPSNGGPRGAVVVGLVGLFAAVVPMLFMAGTSCKGSTEGHVTVSAGPRPGFTFTPTGCDSMQPYGRFGANLHGDGPNDGAVYVSRDPTRGPAVEVEIPGSCRNSDGTDCTVVPLPRDRCNRFEVDLDFNGTVVNDVRQVEGRVAVDCTLEDGTVVRGAVTFGGC